MNLEHIGKVRFPWALALLALSITFFGCDKGIEPKSNVGFFSGVIRYKNWPTNPDSLRDLRVIAFRVFPPSDVVNEVLRGRAVVHPPLGDGPLLPFYVDSLRYTVNAQPGDYKYVVIAQQWGPSVTTDWRPVGQYDLDSDLTIPSPITITADGMTMNVDINVDFNNPPPPPF